MKTKLLRHRLGAPDARKRVRLWPARFALARRNRKRAQSMAVAIWFMMGAVMSVLTGVGALSFKLWKHGRMPLEPHQELVEEDFQKYD